MKKFILPISIFISLIVIYFFTSGGNTLYDYFTRLAASFLEGKYWLTQNPPWLSELIPAGLGRFYVVYPPMPAIILMPFVFLFGANFPQQYLAHLIGAGIAVLTLKLSLTVQKDYKLAIWTTLTIGLGSIIWYLSSVGSVWYLGQITACFFITAALVESLNKKRVFLVGIFLGAAYLSRIHTILSVFLFFFLLKDKLTNIKSVIKFLLPMALFFLFDCLYNYLRYQVPWNNGYFLIPGTLDEPWFSKGIMHPSYIIENLKIAFLAIPNFYNHFPYIQPSWAGLAIWITTPAFIFSLWAKFKEKITKFLWLSIFLIFLVVGAHGATGFAQFGYRFAVDFYPFLTLLMIKGVASQKGPLWYHWLLLAWAIMVNLWGVVWINIFGWVSY
jgi:hypothetical protein